jgi:hypothetical protein
LKIDVSTEEVAALIEVQEKCTKLFVLSVGRNAKFLSNQQKASLSFVEIVLLKEEDFSNF